MKSRFALYRRFEHLPGIHGSLDGVQMLKISLKRLYQGKWAREAYRVICIFAKIPCFKRFGDDVIHLPILVEINNTTFSISSSTTSIITRFVNESGNR